MTMGYPGYVTMVAVAALAASGLSLAALWFLGPALLARGAASPAPGDPPRPAPAPAAGGDKRGQRFDFTPEQAPALAALLARETGDDIGLVLWYLPAPSALALLAALPEAKRPGALLGMAARREVDGGLVRAVRGELEDRLFYGSVGGPQEAAALAKSLPYGERKILIEAACAADPVRAAGLRGQVLLDEDLLEMGAGDVEALASAVRAQDMAAYLKAMPGPLQEKLRAAYPPKAAALFDKAPDCSDVNEAEARLGEFLDLVEKISARGLMNRPRPKAKPAAAAVPAAPAAPAAPAGPAKRKDDDWG